MSDLALPNEGKTFIGLPRVVHRQVIMRVSKEDPRTGEHVFVEEHAVCSSLRWGNLLDSTTPGLQQKRGTY